VFPAQKLAHFFLADELFPAQRGEEAVAEKFLQRLEAFHGHFVEPVKERGQHNYRVALPSNSVRLVGMSRSGRILGSDSGGLCHYHVMSRCVDRQMAFDDVARE
jgi:hypothetical protein